MVLVVVVVLLLLLAVFFGSRKDDVTMLIVLTLPPVSLNFSSPYLTFAPAQWLNTIRHTVPTPKSPRAM